MNFRLTREKQAKKQERKTSDFLLCTKGQDFRDNIYVTDIKINKQNYICQLFTFDIFSFVMPEYVYTLSRRGR